MLVRRLARRLQSSPVRMGGPWGSVAQPRLCNGRAGGGEKLGERTRWGNGDVNERGSCGTDKRGAVLAAPRRRIGRNSSGIGRLMALGLVPGVQLSEQMKVFSLMDVVTRGGQAQGKGWCRLYRHQLAWSRLRIETPRTG